MALNPDHRRWNAGRQHEHGMGIYGGDNITLYRITVRDTYGDGIYVGYIPGRIAPSSRITMGRLNITRVGRNGVGIVGGHYLKVSDSVISGAGLHAVDLEPDSRTLTSTTSRSSGPAWQLRAGQASTLDMRSRRTAGPGDERHQDRRQQRRIGSMRRS